MLRKGHILVILVSAICLVTVPVFAQNMGFYENKLYDFSYNLPTDWVYRENYLLPDGSTFQVIQNPKEFEPMHFLQSPIIFVKFENLKNINEGKMIESMPISMNYFEKNEI